MKPRGKRLGRKLVSKIPQINSFEAILQRLYLDQLQCVSAIQAIITHFFPIATQILTPLMFDTMFSHLDNTYLTIDYLAAKVGMMLSTSRNFDLTLLPTLQKSIKVFEQLLPHLEYSQISHGYYLALSKQPDILQLIRSLRNNDQLTLLGFVDIPSIIALLHSHIQSFQQLLVDAMKLVTPEHDQYEEYIEFESAEVTPFKELIDSHVSAGKRVGDLFVIANLINLPTKFITHDLIFLKREHVLKLPKHLSIKSKSVSSGTQSPSDGHHTALPPALPARPGLSYQRESLSPQPSPSNPNLQHGELFLFNDFVIYAEPMFIGGFRIIANIPFKNELQVEPLFKPAPTSSSLSPPLPSRQLVPLILSTPTTPSTPLSSIKTSSVSNSSNHNNPLNTLPQSIPPQPSLNLTNDTQEPDYYDDDIPPPPINSPLPSPRVKSPLPPPRPVSPQQSLIQPTSPGSNLPITLTFGESHFAQSPNQISSPSLSSLSSMGYKPPIPSRRSNNSGFSVNTPQISAIPTPTSSTISTPNTNTVEHHSVANASSDEFNSLSCSDLQFALSQTSTLPLTNINSSSQSTTLKPQDQNSQRGSVQTLISPYLLSSQSFSHSMSFLSPLNGEPTTSHHPYQTTVHQFAPTPYQLKLTTSSQTSSKDILYICFETHVQYEVWMTLLKDYITYAQTSSQEKEIQLIDSLTENMAQFDRNQLLTTSNCTLCARKLGTLFSPLRHCKKCMRSVCTKCSDRILVAGVKVRVCEECKA